jgi:hypothetical protein
VVVAAFLLGIAGCGGVGGGHASMRVPEGASSPEQAVEAFLTAAGDAQRSKAASEFTEADRAYERMAAVFGTERGSIRRSFSAEDVRNRMLVLAACLRPASFRLVSQQDPRAWRAKHTTITAQIDRGRGTLTLPFKVILGRGERWFIEQIDVSTISC